MKKNYVRDARKSYIKEIESSNDIINKIVDLFLRINNTDKAEEVSTIIYAVKEVTNQLNTVPTEKDVLEYVLNWKKKMDRVKVKKTIRNLAILGWITVKASSEI